MCDANGSPEIALAASGRAVSAAAFPECRPGPFRALAEAAGLDGIDCAPIEVETGFADFDDFWRPFTLGAGPAPGYCAKLPPASQHRLRKALDRGLPRRPDGSIVMAARVRALKARLPRSGRALSPPTAPR